MKDAVGLLANQAARSADALGTAAAVAVVDGGAVDRRSHNAAHVARAANFGMVGTVSHRGVSGHAHNAAHVARALHGAGVFTVLHRGCDDAGSHKAARAAGAVHRARVGADFHHGIDGAGGMDADHAAHLMARDGAGVCAAAHGAVVGAHQAAGRRGLVGIGDVARVDAALHQPVVVDGHAAHIALGLQVGSHRQVAHHALLADTAKQALHAGQARDGMPLPVKQTVEGHRRLIGVAVEPDGGKGFPGCVEVGRQIYPAAREVGAGPYQFRQPDQSVPVPDDIAGLRRQCVPLRQSGDVDTRRHVGRGRHGKCGGKRQQHGCRKRPRQQFLFHVHSSRLLVKALSRSMVGPGGPGL